MTSTIATGLIALIVFAVAILLAFAPALDGTAGYEASGSELVAPSSTDHPQPLPAPAPMPVRG